MSALASYTLEPTYIEQSESARYARCIKASKNVSAGTSMPT
jgi:hypothetical protein